MISILNVITFRHIGQILFENKRDTSQTRFNEEEKQSEKTHVPSKQKTFEKQTKSTEKLFVSQKVLRKPSIVIGSKEEVTNLESPTLSSPPGFKDPRSSESELVTNQLSIRENVFCYDSKPQARNSPKDNAEVNAKRKLKQVWY